MTDKRHTYSIRVDWTGNQGTGRAIVRSANAFSALPPGA
jgi:hypothetical protein